MMADLSEGDQAAALKVKAHRSALHDDAFGIQTVFISAPGRRFSEMSALMA